MAVITRLNAWHGQIVSGRMVQTYHMAKKFDGEFNLADSEDTTKLKPDKFTSHCYRGQAQNFLATPI